MLLTITFVGYCWERRIPVNVKQLFDLTGRVAIVSGGSIGLGRQMAEGLAEMGANLVLCARKKERCEEAADELRALGVQALALGCDVRDKAAIQEVVDATLAKFGRIDILVNNAGVSWAAPVEEMTLEQWDKVLSTNLTGTFLFCQAAGKAMVAQRSGKIINIASVAGLGGASAELQAIGYHASKGGVIAFTKDLACKWAPHNIQVNAIAPGWFPNAYVGLGHRAPERFAPGEDSVGPLWWRSRSERCGGISGVGRFGLCDRARAGRRWRPVGLVRQLS